jgi:hypothetical protein
MVKPGPDAAARRPADRGFVMRKLHLAGPSAATYMKDVRGDC